MPNARPPALPHQTPRQTLYEMHLWDAINRAMESLEGRERLTTSLSPFATRAIFLLTTPDTISNKELLDVLTGEPSGTHSGAENDSLVRHYRQIGKERGLKIETARYLIVRLLNQDAIPKSDAVRVWYYALIQYAAVVTVVSELKARQTDSATAANDDELMTRAHEFLVETLDDYLAKSYALVDANAPMAERQEFLDFGTSLHLKSILRAPRRCITRSPGIANYGALRRNSKSTSSTSASLNVLPLAHLIAVYWRLVTRGPRNEARYRRTYIRRKSRRAAQHHSADIGELA
jgi:hypothetical protein